MAGAMLQYTHKENKRAKSERSFTLFYGLNYLGFELDFEFGLGLTLGLEFV